MSTYLVRRLLQGVLVIVLVSIFVFVAMRLLPGDPLRLFMAQSQIGNLSPADMAALRHRFGLDRSMAVQYFTWMGQVLHGDFGTSIFLNENISSLIKERVPLTLYYGVLAGAIGSILGIIFGMISAIRRGKWSDTVITVLANVGITVPSFWIGVLLIYSFSYKIPILPVGGLSSPFQDVWLSTRQLIMPVLCLALFPIAALARQTRSSMLEIVGQDYIRTAWSKGLRERVIVLRHTIKNALIPVVTSLGIQVGYIFSGSVLIETVFNIPGIGRLLATSLFSQDYQVVKAVVLIVALAVVIANLAVDLLYGWLDPRIRYG